MGNDCALLLSAEFTPLLKQAETIATRIAEALAYVGVLGVEMFVTESGEILVNEIAPRAA